MTLTASVFCRYGTRKITFHRSEVGQGTQTIKIGFRRDILKVISKLRIHTCDTVILEDVISLSRICQPFHSPA